MANYDYYKRQDTGSIIPSVKPGENWFFIRVQPKLQPMATADNLKLFQVYNHWIIKDGFSRIYTATTAAATADIGTAAGGQEISAALDLDSAADTWVRFTAVDDDAPVAITTDGYIYFECLDADIYDGIIDLLFEVVVCNTDTDASTSFAE